MADARTYRLRVEFCKQGRLALLSHLEVARALERTVRRAALPYTVSQGFSPHMKIAFGAALPVGVGGTCECFDLQLSRYVSPERALAALQEASALDLMVKQCAYVEATAPAASVAFPVSTYRALLSCAPAQLPVPQSIVVTRKRKEKVLQVADFLMGSVELAGAVVTFSLEAKPTGSLRPDLLLKSCIDAYNALASGDAAGAASKDSEEESNADIGGGAAIPLSYAFVDNVATGGEVEACGASEQLRLVSLARIAQKTSAGIDFTSTLRH